MTKTAADRAIRGDRDEDDRIDVLIVDDVPELRTLLRYMFEFEPETYGRIWEAADGREALAVARKHDPDLVILDVAMPYMDGLTALPHLRRSLPDSRIVIYTGSYPEDVEARAAQGGANAVMTKAVPPEDFYAALAQVMARPAHELGPDRLLVVR